MYFWCICSEVYNIVNIGYKGKKWYNEDTCRRGKDRRPSLRERGKKLQLGEVNVYEC